MPFSEVGFLGREAVSFSAENRSRFKEHFALATDLNRKGHLLLEAVKPKVNDHHIPITVVTLYLRVLSSLAASLKLMEAGIGVDAGTTTRSLVESTIVLRKCALEPSWIPTYAKMHLHHKLAIANVMLEYKQFSAKKEEIEKVRDELKSQIEKEKIPKLDVAALARDPLIDAKGFYDSIYRILSNESTHSSPKSLESFLKLSHEGDLEAIYYGNYTKMLPHLMSACCWGIWSSMDSVKSLFEVDMELDDGLGGRLMTLFGPSKAPGL